METGQIWICKSIKITKCTLCGSGNQNSQLLMYRRLLGKQIKYLSCYTFLWAPYERPDDFWSDPMYYLDFPYIEEKVCYTDIKMT